MTQRRGLGGTSGRRTARGTRPSLGAGGDQEKEVMQFALVIDAEQISRVFILGLKTMKTHKSLSGEGKE